MDPLDLYIFPRIIRELFDFLQNYLYFCKVICIFCKYCVRVLFQIYYCVFNQILSLQNDGSIIGKSVYPWYTKTFMTCRMYMIWYRTKRLSREPLPV